jgi:anti-anti-sigma factor
MQALMKSQGEITIVTIQGSLHIEKTQPFREICLKHFLTKKVIFNMENASFMGSTGLQAFLGAIKTITEENEHGLKLVGVKSEFRKILQNIENQKLQIFESEALAINSFAANFTMPQATLE